MARAFTNRLLAGVTAAVIWMAIGLWVGLDSQTVGLWALILLVVTTVVSAIVGAVIGRAAAGRGTTTVS